MAEGHVTRVAFDERGPVGWGSCLRRLPGMRDGSRNYRRLRLLTPSSLEGQRRPQGSVPSPRAAFARGILTLAADHGAAGQPRYKGCAVAGMLQHGGRAGQRLLLGWSVPAPPERDEA